MGAWLAQYRADSLVIEAWEASLRELEADTLAARRGTCVGARIANYADTLAGYENDPSPRVAEAAAGLKARADALRGSTPAPGVLTCFAVGARAPAPGKTPPDAQDGV